MNMPGDEGNAEISNSSRLSYKQLVESNARLLDETARLCTKNAELTRQLIVARTDSNVHREARRAALNLMQDAIAARLAEQRENTERLRAEKESRASLEKYRSLFESIDEGFFIAERVQFGASGPIDFRILEANPAFSIQLGVSDGIGKTMRQTFPGEAEEWYSTFEQVVITGKSIRFERELATQARFLELYAFRPVGESNGRVAVIFKNVSARKAAEAALRDADRRKDEFLATLAHELRNPLAPICNALQLLQLYAKGDPEAADVLELMNRQLSHMVRLIDDLMEVSRITRGVFELRKQDTELATIIHSALELSRPLIDAGDHHLTVSLPEMPIPIYGDAVRLGQVFANLLNNAAKYTENGGRIWLDAHREGRDVVVSVRDTGIGISPSMLNAVFDMFVQADHSSQSSRGGLGIGLTLAKRLIEAHGGRISAQSEGTGRGSEFVVRLPAGKCSAQGNVPRKPAHARGEGVVPCRVLVVDDNQDSASSLGMLLKSLVADVRTVHDGVAALELLESYRPDVVFLDIGMPVMDGIEVARRIRAQPNFDSVKLIAVTGWGTDGDRRRTRTAGFNRHLVKPVQFAELETLLSPPE
jgi:signal transduction histidine kinase